MREWIPIVVISAIGSFASGCALTLYQSWGKQLTELPLRNGRIDDVSLLLGTPPTRCEPIKDQQPIIGLSVLDPKKPVVSSVLPNGPASEAGIRPGDNIVSVGGQSVADGLQILSALRANAREGQPLKIETSRGSVVVVPKMPVAEQCYWEVQAGNIARAGGSAFVNRWFGSASSGASAYQRFFRASCRIHDGFVTGCTSNWQN